MLNNDFEGYPSANKPKSINGTFVVKKAKDISDFSEILDFEIAACIEANIDLPIVHVSQSLLKKLSLSGQSVFATVGGPVELKTIQKGDSHV